MPMETDTSKIVRPSTSQMKSRDEQITTMMMLAGAWIDKPHIIMIIQVDNKASFTACLDTKLNETEIRKGTGRLIAERLREEDKNPKPNNYKFLAHLYWEKKCSERPFLTSNIREGYEFV